MKGFKKQTSAVVAAFASAGVLAAFQSQVSAQSSGPNLNEPGEIRWVKGRILVQPRSGLSVQELDKKLKTHGGRRVDVIQQLNIHVVQLPSTANERAIAALLKSDAHISFAEVDEQLSPAMTPTDPAYGNSWHHPKIGTPAAWDSSSGEGVTIAILDTGVDGTHPDLVGNIVPGYNAYDNNSDTRDVYGHGTKVAGSAAMAGNNAVGGTGVAFKSRIMPIRVTDTAGYGYHSTMAKGLVWAADNGARVANMSFARVCGSSTIWNAAQYMRNKGGIVTGAAGNSGVEEAMSPSDTMTCVSATDGSDVKTGFSSYGGYVDVAAPGVSIYVTTNGGGYGSTGGTSFSAPITAAVYALMMSANRNLTSSQLDAALFSTATDLGNGGKDTYYGYGRVDAAAAVAKARGTSGGDSIAPSVAIASPGSSAKVSGLVAVDVSASDNIAVTRVDLYVGQTLIGSDATAPYGFSWDTSGLADGQVTLEARAFDAAGNTGSTKATVTVANDTISPSIAISNPQSGSVVTGPTTISASATDNKRVAKVSLKIDGQEVSVAYGATLSYSWDPYKGGKGKGRGKGPKSGPGTYSISATATDDAGNSNTTSVGVTVQ